MQYRWDGFSLDHEVMLLMHQGRRLDVPRKTFRCIHHLIEHRHRVVGYDELIRVLWGHDNVTNHQLSQVILSARRTVGDDGQTQRLIRTAPGEGYHWIGVISEDNAPSLQAPQPSIETTSPVPPEVAETAPGGSSPASTPAPPTLEASTIPGMAETGPGDTIPASTPASPTPEASTLPGKAAEVPPAGMGSRRPTRKLGWIAASVLGLSGAAMYATMRAPTPPHITSPAATPPADPLAVIEAALMAGRYEDVREGLAQLPPDIAGSPQGKLLEVHLDIERGRTELALQKLEREQVRADAAQDTLWRARVAIMRSRIYFRDGNPPQEIRAAAQTALDLLASMGDAAPPKDVSAAFANRAIGLGQEGRPDEGVLDLVKARDILLSVGDKRGAAWVRGNLARTLIRTGHLREALDELQAVLETTSPSSDLVRQLHALNSITQIEIELLRWDAALSANEKALRLLRQAPESDRRHRALMMRAFILSEKGRLHEAASHLEEAEQLAEHDRTYASSTRVMHDIASRNVASAMTWLQRDLGSRPQTSNFNVMLEDTEGMLLLWMLAARDLAAQGKPIPELPAEARKAILNPKTATGHIARGRWRWMQGDAQSAEADFRQALQETRRMGHSYRMTLAGEALIELLLKRGDADGARIVLEGIRAHQSTNADRDYRSSVMALRVALAGDDQAQIRTAYARVRALAGERLLPANLSQAYARYGFDSSPAQGAITTRDATSGRATN